MEATEEALHEDGAEERQQAEAFLNDQTEPMLTSAEVAELAGVGKQSVGNWTAAGTLPFTKQAIRVNGHRRWVRMFRRSDVEQFLIRRAAGEQRITAPRAQPGRRRKGKARSLGIDELIANIEREIITLKRLRETERKDIEQEVKARLVAQIQRNHA